ncbi:MAG: hypothetical protein GY940_43325, partial [bacterium]|nr:hypothetical protein [bacterium]
EKIIGMFVNTLVLRNRPGGGEKLAHFLEEVKEKTLEAFENQDYPYEDLPDQLEIRRDASRNPLFDTMFAMQNFAAPAIEIPGLTMSVYHHHSLQTQTAKFDLTLQCVEMEEGLLCNFEYRTSLFKETTIHRFVSYFKQLLSRVLADDSSNLNTPLKDLEIITPQEKKQILEDFNTIGKAYPTDKTLHQLFQQQAERTPDSTAIMSMAQGDPGGAPIKPGNSPIIEQRTEGSIRARGHGGLLPSREGTLSTTKEERWGMSVPLIYHKPRC